MNYELSPLDRKILNILQQNYPVCVNPYESMARKLEIPEDELLQRLAAMKEAGIIRRIGGIIESKAIGYYSTLCTCRADNDRVEEIAALINEQPGVTHNYLRDHEYNLWFTLTSESRQKSDEIINALESRTGVKILSMPTDKVYKIRVALDMGENYAIR